ncbi:MAG: hypothetical protein J6M94_08635 [Prevotella sp.]|nr:hypothetical protein [Prevotella sp.]
MNRFFVLILLYIMCAGSMTAQRKLAVLDFETGFPIEGVSVIVDSLEAKKTNGLGVVFIQEPFDSITFSHLKYGKEKLAREEITDTMYLFAKDFMLDEVVVVGLSPELLKQVRAKREEILSAPDHPSLLTFDLGKMLDKRGRRDRKHLKRARKIIKEWDDAPAARNK